MLVNEGENIWEHQNNVLRDLEKHYTLWCRDISIFGSKLRCELNGRGFRHRHEQRWRIGNSASYRIHLLAPLNHFRQYFTVVLWLSDGSLQLWGRIGPSHLFILSYWSARREIGKNEETRRMLHLDVWLVIRWFIAALILKRSYCTSKRAKEFRLSILFPPYVIGAQ